MVLSNRVKVTSPYKGKSKFDFWNDLQVGDTLVIYMELKHSGWGSKGNLMPTINVMLIEEVEEPKTFSGSFNDINNYLSKIDHETY